MAIMSLREQREQMDLARDRLVEVAEVERFVLGMRVRVRIFDAYQECGHAAQGARERVDERNRPAATDEERLLAVAERERTTCLLEHGPGGFGRPPGAGVVAALNTRLQSPRHLLLQVIDDLLLHSLRLLIGNDAHADARPRRV